MNALPDIEPHDAAWLDRASLVPVVESGDLNPLSAIVEHAIHYATSNGWSVFPAPPGEKKSYYKATEANGNRKWGQMTAAAEIRLYWKQRPNANVCIVTGTVSGIFVVETDTAAGHDVDGGASLAALEVEHGPLPATRQAISPSGSIHRYFKHPGFKVINSESVIAPGVDVRGDGGMVVAPPTERHTTDIAMLRGSRMVTATETEEGRHWAEARIKQLTGGDSISARFMRQDNFTFRPNFKLTIIGNHKPVLRSVDDAARRRFNIIPFNRKPTSPDRMLEKKLMAEAPAILRWMIDGCVDWQATAWCGRTASRRRPRSTSRTRT